MTKQIKDILHFDRNEYTLNVELLESYFSDHLERRPRPRVMMTALWRGYVATFEIKNDELFVKDLEIFTNLEKWATESVLDKAFPDSKKLTWFSGLVRIDEYRGEYDDEKPGSIFKFLEIRNGNLIKLRSLSYEELQLFKNEQFALFKQSGNYDPILSHLKNKGMTDEKANDFIAENILEYTKEVLVD